VRRHPVRNGILAALTAGLLGLTVAVLADFGSPPAGAQPTTQTVSASVGSAPSGAPLPTGFLGLSLEYNGLHAYTGNNPKAVNPVLIQLIRGLSPSQAPMLRIGGESTDSTWWPVRGLKRPTGINYTLTNSWLRTTQALASALGAKLIMGVNLASGSPAVAVAEARALYGGIGKRFIQALEIGNEPDVYGQFTWYESKGKAYYARAHNYDLNEFISQFSQWHAALGEATPVTGPAFAELNWLSGLGTFISAQPGLKVLTVHRYPLHGCLNNPSAPGYPSIANLLNDQASSGIAQQVAPYASEAHNTGLQLRVDEMNSAAVASCLGRRGVSGTFASALWVLDALFNLQSVGVDGVNIHSLPRAAYELFTFKHSSSGWQAFVHPEYYGMLLFAQAFPPGAQPLPVNVSPSGPLKVWATGGPGFPTRVVLLNKDPTNPYQVQLQVAGLTGPAQVERLEAPSASARSGVTLGEQTFGNETTTGKLAAPRTQPVVPVLGTYTITVPAASAAMLSPAVGSGGVAGPG
jgi:glycosyl hydrolase family 79